MTILRFILSLIINNIEAKKINTNNSSINIFGNLFNTSKYLIAPNSLVIES